MDGSRVDTKGFTSVQMVHTHNSFTAFHAQLFHIQHCHAHNSLSHAQLCDTHTRNSFTHTHNFIMVFLRGSRSIWSRPRSLSVAVTGELLGDIHAWFPQHRHTLPGKPFAWQAWRWVISTLTFCGRRGRPQNLVTSRLTFCGRRFWLLWCAWFPVVACGLGGSGLAWVACLVPAGAAQLCLTGPFVISTLTLCGGCGTYCAGLALAVLGSTLALGDIHAHFVQGRLWHLMALGWAPGRFGGDTGLARAACLAPRSLCAVLHDILARFVWQAWRLWLTALGGTLLCNAGVAFGDIHVTFAWQAWRLVTSTLTFFGRDGWLG